MNRNAHQCIWTEISIACIIVNVQYLLSHWSSDGCHMVYFRPYSLHRQFDLFIKKKLSTTKQNKKDKHNKLCYFFSTKASKLIEFVFLFSGFFFFLHLHHLFFIYLKYRMDKRLQLQLCISRADIRNTDVDNDCVLHNHGTCFMGQPVDWRAHSTPNRINKIEEKGLYFSHTYHTHILIYSYTHSQFHPQKFTQSVARLHVFTNHSSCTLKRPLILHSL